MRKKKSLFYDMQIEVSRPKTQHSDKQVLSIEEEIQQVTDSIDNKVIVSENLRMFKDCLNRSFC